MALYTKNVSSYFTSSIPSASSWFELYAAFSTFMMLLRTAINDIVPLQLRNLITTKLESFFANFQSGNQVSLKIDRTWDRNSGKNRNELYHAAHQYLPSRINRTYKALKVAKLEDCKNLVLAVDGNQQVVDEFEGTNFTWMLDERTEKDSSKPKYTFILSFHEKHRDKAMERYIPHVLRTYEAMKAEQKIVKIYSRSCDYWEQSELTHPATFDTLALDPELKKAIIDDLDRFLRRKELYKRVGKPWKRGYLLYGPPGTGKSSLVAAIANYLKFDVYDLELNSVFSNTDLMRAIRNTSNRSIIVIEDIDCNKEVQPRSATEDPSADSESEKEGVGKGKGFTLSGLLNYMDGLWSSCGEERIIVFTTNHKERIDAALLRPGRMDMHINLSFLKGKGFRVLASNYLGVDGDHRLFQQIDELLEKTEVTPAVVAEHLMRYEDPDLALEAIAKFLTEMDVHNQVDLQFNTTSTQST
ncbi:hypothetical protein PIB30_017173 [Stylosanthes scabra]|uniref:AAA+ ATPase domain-containing protein n=1 Tax=Stylosanthes scabra TaxID=79078 RepID=A0ABU6W781_9FABA|nr:hypothetical protein [Stylosanthes scabra]